MKYAVLVSGAAIALGIAGCGWYTNVPAMIHVKSVEPATVTVEFKTNKADQAVTATYTNPTITLEGQPGSIGATYKDMRIAYYDRAVSKEPDLNKPMAEVAGGQEAYLKAFVRVEPSTQREDPSKGYIEMAGMSEKRLISGTAKFVAPIITNEILSLGDPKATTRKSLIFARIVLTGEDDAKWQAVKEIFIPITFVDSVK